MRLVRHIAPLLFVALVACSGGDGGGKGYGKGKGKGKHHKKPDPVSLVETKAVEKGDVSELISSSAIIESEAQADIYPVATGVVLSLHKDEGDAVRRGDLLAVVDNVSLAAGNTRASDEVKRLEKQLGELQALRASGAVSQRELDDLAYQLQTAKTSAREARRSYGQTRMTAPFAGVVALRDVRVGELAGSSKPAFQIVDLDRLRVVASLPERDIKRVAEGQAARLVSAYDEDVFTGGRVQRIAPVIDAASGTFRVTVALDADQTALRPGQFVNVQLEVDKHSDVLTVPRVSVIWEDGAPIVYTKIPKPPDEDKDGKGKMGGKAEDSDPWEALAGLWPFGDDEASKDEDGAKKDTGPAFIARRTPVKLGLVDEDLAEITEGLEEGAEVVVVGQSNLRDGARIRTKADEGDSEKAKADADADGEGDAAADG